MTFEELIDLIKYECDVIERFNSIIKSLIEFDEYSIDAEVIGIIAGQIQDHTMVILNTSIKITDPMLVDEEKEK